MITLYTILTFVTFYYYVSVFLLLSSEQYVTRKQFYMDLIPLRLWIKKLIESFKELE